MSGAREGVESLWARLSAMCSRERRRKPGHRVADMVAFKCCVSRFAWWRCSDITSDSFEDLSCGDKHFFPYSMRWRRHQLVFPSENSPPLFIDSYRPPPSPLRPNQSHMPVPTIQQTHTHTHFMTRPLRSLLLLSELCRKPVEALI